MDSEKFKNAGVVIHAGHYLLFPGENMVTDFFYNPSDAAQWVRDFRWFSELSWRTACAVAARRPVALRPRMIILVNDWQHMPTVSLDRRENEKSLTRLRREYYEREFPLPSLHKRIMALDGLQPEDILPASEKQWLFSESALRAQFAKTIKSVMKDPANAARLGLEKRLDSNREPIISVETEGQSCSLLHCGNANCAGEVVELLRQLFERGVRNFINIYPGQCDLYVERGTEISRQLFGLEGMEIENVAVHF
jgi:hypothetical protein